MMTQFQRIFAIPLIVGILLIPLHGCGGGTELTESERSPTPGSSPSPTTTSDSSDTSDTPLSQPHASSSTSTTPGETTETVTVTIYKADSQCVNFLPEDVEVAANRPMEDAVGKVLAVYSTSDFDLSGYRLSVEDGTATVDFRLSPDSPRQLTSLSACEQYALFGSLRETLTQNSDWQIDTVRFTERGEEIVL